MIQKLIDISVQTEAIEYAKNHNLEAVENISTVIQQNSAATMEMSESISGQRQQVEKMAEFTNDLQSISLSLKEAIAKFTIV